MTPLTNAPERPPSAEPGTLAPVDGTPAPSRRLYRFAVFVSIATLLLIKVGAMVTSTGSGMAFPDWPLANGSWWPPGLFSDPDKLAGLFEHGHRAIGTTIGLLVLSLTIWIGVAEPRAWLRKLALGVLFLVCAQGVIGGVGVEQNLLVVTSVTHGVLAQVILCLLVLIAFALSPAWQARHPIAPSIAGKARRLAAFALFLVFVQLVSGAILRHTSEQGMLWLHIGMATVVLFAIMIAAMYAGHHAGHLPGFRRLGHIVLGVLAAQIVLGIVSVVIRRGKQPSNIEYLGRSFVISLHVITGAILFLSAALLLYRSMRNLSHGRFEVPPESATG